jgi:hypothetical protein
MADQLVNKPDNDDEKILESIEVDDDSVLL